MKLQNIKAVCFARNKYFELNYSANKQNEIMLEKRPTKGNEDQFYDKKDFSSELKVLRVKIFKKKLVIGIIQLNKCFDRKKPSFYLFF